jgi:hypothetical protein
MTIKPEARSAGAAPMTEAQRVATNRLFAGFRGMMNFESNSSHLAARQLQLWSIEAGMEHVPLENLQRFADLVRADMRAFKFARGEL